MAIGITDEKNYQDIADAIREKNGSSDTYTPSEMADAIRGIEGGEGFDLTQVGGSLHSAFNGWFKDKINKTLELFPKMQGNIRSIFQRNNDIVFAKSYAPITNAQQALQNCSNLMFIDFEFAEGAQAKWMLANNNKLIEVSFTIPKKMAIEGLLYKMESVEKLTINGRSDVLIFEVEANVDISDFARSIPKITSPIVIPNGVNNTYLAFSGCTNLPHIDLGSVTSSSFADGVFNGCSSLKILRFVNWIKNNVNLTSTSVLLPESIHYIIQNAVDVADGATARTLTLHATAKTNWEASEYYDEDMAVLNEKGITIA